MYLGYQNGKIKFYTEEMLNPSFYQLDKQEYTEDVYVLDGEEYVLKDEAWEEKQAQKERERIAMLSLTAADVERAIYKAKGMDFEDIIKLVEESNNVDEQNVTNSSTIQPFNLSTSIDVKALKIELKANNFYRGNPYIDQVGALLGFTSEQLDKFFETGNYMYLITEFEHNITEEVADADE